MTGLRRPRAIAFLAALLLLASASHAASVSLEVVGGYDLGGGQVGVVFGESIILRLTGDPMAGSAIAIFAQLNLDDGGGLISFVSSSQTPGTSFGGAITWTPGALSQGLGYASVMNQILSIAPIPADPGTMPQGTVVMHWVASGFVTVSVDAPSFDFFGASPPPPLTLVTLDEHPSPAPSLGPMGLGVLAAALLGVLVSNPLKKQGKSAS